mmetsp:Transcript_41077/g.76419  ORF Transcript_41077/g.76419 Transcript_41077/m.76419 type:complete len:114 (+) Transcript_41077:51-392(+)
MPETPAKSREGWGLFVTGLPGEVEDDDLDEAFRPFGTITSLHVPLNRMTGEAKGYCMLEFQTYKEASAALDAMHGKQLRGREISVSWLCKEDSDAHVTSERRTSDARSRSPKR